MASNLAIEFTDIDCKVVQVDRSKGGKLAIRSMASFPVPKNDDAAARVEERSRLLRDALKTGKITGQAARVVIPKNFVMARTVTLPSTADEEIKGMARFEAERHIPFNAERHIVAHHTLARQGMQGSDVLLAAVDRPIAQEYMDICVKAGLKVDSVSVSSLAVYNAFASAEPTAMQDRVVAVVNIGRAATDLVIANNGIVNFTRGSTLGVNKLLAELQEADATSTLEAEDLAKMDALEPHLFFHPQAVAPPVPSYSYDEILDTGTRESSSTGTYPGVLRADGGTGSIVDAAPVAPPPPPAVATAPDNKQALVFTNWLLRVLQEVKRTYEFAHREFDTPMVDHIYVCGEGSLIQNLSQYFRVNFGVEASTFDPLQNTELPKKLSKELLARGPSFAAAIGAAAAAEIVPHSVHVNLLPPEYLEKQEAKRQQQSYITTGILALIALGLAYFYMSDVFNTKRAMFEELVGANNRDKARVTDLQAKRQRLDIIKQNVQDDQGALDVLEKLSKLEYIPEKVTMTRFEYKKADYVKVSGHAKDLESANLLVAALRNMASESGGRYFEDARLDESNRKQLRGRGSAEVLEWSATAVFPKKEKKKATSRPADQGTEVES
jgi:type IV pilus assembly protein PilM